MPDKAHRQLGLTLTELMVTLAVAAILIGIGVPSFEAMIRMTRSSTYTNAMVASIWLARSESIKRKQPVTLCKSATGSGCTNDNDWAQGWIVFADANGDAQLGADEDLLAHQAALARNWKATGDGKLGNYLMYRPSGRPQMTDGMIQNGTITICYSGSETASKIVINDTGRPRLDKEELEADC